MQPSFVHLRLHSEYSIADGIVRIGEAVSAAKADAMPALALTDLSNVFGLVKFYKEARGAGIKPIVGCDVYVSNDAVRDQPFRLLLLCQSHAGYLRLCGLLTRAYLENQYRGRPEIRTEWLRDGTDGLIALSGAHLGEVGMTLLNGNASSAEVVALGYADLFPQRFYLEVQRFGAAREEQHLRDTVKLASKLALPVVATHPVQFLTIDDFKAHEARVCIAEGYVLNDKRRQRQFTAQQYFKTQAEMAALFADLPEALQNSVEIAKRCNISLKLGKPHLPDFPTPNGESLDDFLRSESQRGLEQRMLQLYPDETVRAAKMAEYQARLDFEVNTIINMKFPGYFLIVADFIRWAKSFRDARFPNGVPVGPGRGSGAGSLVAYSLGITDLDPLRYELLFERFLNPERVSMPDFDVDFCQDGRELVIQYVRHHYGEACVSQIATFGTMASKGVIRDVGRVLDFPYGLCDRLSKLVPVEGVKPVSLRKAREMEPEFNAVIASEEGVEELMELGERLEDLTRNVGMHAGGVLIAPGKLTDFCPLYCAEGSESTVSQYDKDDVEAVGLVKFDFLGLRTLTIIDWAVRYIQDLGTGISDLGSSNAGAGGDAKSQIQNPKSFSIENIPLDDKATYDRIFRTANTTAVFQFESRGMKDTLVKAQPDCIDDLIALNALYRPGPMDFIPDYINRKHKREQVILPHPLLEKVVGNTYGIMVYQEQVMQSAQVVAGYTLGGADMLRRAMGKKKAEEMAEQRSIFVAGAAKNGIEEKKANEIFDTMEKFAGYGFNKSHAAAYSLVAYQTAYLKCHYPAAFMASTMTSEMVNTDKVSFFYQDAVQQGLKILAPDINSSCFRFQPVDEKTIAYGLGAVKGTGEAAVENIVAARAAGPFRDLFDFCHRVDKRIVNRRAIEALIRAGAFDSISDHRYQLLASLDAALGSAEQKARAANQNSLFGDDEAHAMPVQMADVPRWKMREQLAQEKTALGFYLSGHPYQEFAAELSNFVKHRLADITPDIVTPAGGNSGYGGGRRNNAKSIVLAGMVSGVRVLQTRRGKMAVVTLDDGSAALEVVVFSELFDSNRTWIRDDELLVVSGKAELDAYSGSMRVTADELYDFASARAAYAKRLDICCSIDDKVRVPQLAELLKPYCGGQCPVQINYRNLIGSVPLSLGEAWQVTLPDELLEGLRAMCGERNVRVIYA
ncbi:DNA polymerase III subunit alpha [Sideroxydans lithotrophicus]|uniref:DNA polymerase III subunit alpha n=1 Tax=Sideroxydans lithotrophicus (strain ES-1) TaxID=580332 RepID=D5CN95_SIDLE|nr:DNA polymerase III subunit alpha [Sideroxydans lithotrophicus]ADE12792.1 DNA polymerase III, alpha subunit [Sideroxydans lithotrophicus ES-1]